MIMCDERERKETNEKENRINNLLRENELLKIKYDCEKEIRCALEKQKLELEENIRILIKLNEACMKQSSEALKIMIDRNRKDGNSKRKLRKKKYETSDDENDSDC
jgi:hypothetical protein